MIVAIIQARMGSTRLPGKVLEEVNGTPLLQIMLKRVALAKKIDQIVVATSQLKNDDAIVNYCVKENINVFRGSENDVLSRYYECATKYKATIIVRLTADCPLIDPDVIDNVVDCFQKNEVDYAANTVPPESSTFPDGSDVEVFSYTALTRAYQEASSLPDREHVTFYFWRSPSASFKTIQYKYSENWSKYRLTVDYPEDLAVIKKIISELCLGNKNPSLTEIVHFLNDNPDVYSMNSKYYFGQGWDKK